MSTRGIIARTLPQGGWAGVYHHYDSYPSGLGRMLYQVYHDHFHQDIQAMTHSLIDQHPAGWSTIVDQDFRLDPGFTESRFGEHLPLGQRHRLPEHRRPQCYCHGHRHEPPLTFTGAITDTDCEFAYVIDEPSATMSIYTLRGHQWRLYREVHLNDEAPSWLFERPYE